MPPVRVIESETSAGVIRGRLIRFERFVNKSLNCRFRMRAFFRSRSDKPADHALLGRPSAAEWRVLDAELFAMLVAQVLRKSRRIPIVYVARLPVGRWR